jgi:peptidoglycan/xylan/chitin deacetylase (PgdA/CDA1 family)
VSVGASRARARRSKRVYVTFDDSPDPHWTPAILRELSRAGVNATFFLIAERAASHPEVVQQLIAVGHEVELHCMRHQSHTDGSRDAIDADVRDVQGARVAHHPPAFRTLVRSGSELVGQQSVFKIATDPRRRLFGLGDVAVRPIAGGEASRTR